MLSQSNLSERVGLCIQELRLATAASGLDTVVAAVLKEALSLMLDFKQELAELEKPSSQQGKQGK